MEIQTIDIEISGDISDEIRDQFFNNFTERLSQLHNDTLHETIPKSLALLLYNKPTDALDKYRKIKKDETHKECSICFDFFKENEYKRKLHCNHEFHKKCIDKWINKFNNYTCPICRSDPFTKVHQHICSPDLHQ